MTDIFDELTRVHREVGAREVTSRGETKTARRVVLRRHYDAPLEDVWDAVTNPERISRWFLPVSGDLRLGGTYQLEGNAGGEILRCEPPRHYAVSWIYGVPPDQAELSEVSVTLSEHPGGGTELVLEHVAVFPDEMWDQYGPGAVGVGWDGGLLGLTLHLRGAQIDDPKAWEASEEGREFYTRSSRAWAEAYRASGVSEEVAAAAERATTAFYAPPPDSAGEPGPAR